MKRIIISLAAAALFCTPAMADRIDDTVENASAIEENQPKKKRFGKDKQQKKV